MAIDINKHFGKEVKMYREKQDLSQLQLAEKAKIDLSTINRIERDIANVTLRNVFKIAKAFHTPIYKFFLVDKKSKTLDRKDKLPIKV